MGTTFDGATRADVQRFAPEALDSIILGTNLRHELRGIEEFAYQIATEGQIVPGVVRRDSEGRPVLVAGNRRLAAIRLVNADPAKYGADEPMPFLAVFRKMNEDEALVINLRENLDRDDLSDIDLAHAAVKLERRGWDRKRIAETMRCTSAHVGSLMSLLELPGNVVSMVHQGEIPTSAALAMRKLPRPRVDALAEKLASGDAKPQTIIREAKAEKRAAGKKLSRSIAEVKALLEDLGTGPATDFLAWIDGEATITDEVVRGIFADREHKAA